MENLFELLFGHRTKDDHFEYSLALLRPSHFGNGPESQKFKTLKEQEAALLKALGVAETPPQESNP